MLKSTALFTTACIGLTVLPINESYGNGNTDNLRNPDRPNVIIVITDDQGYGDLGCHGNDMIRTPNLDKFYGESVRLTNFHVSPTCTPTRAALFTGRYPNRLNCFHTIGGRSLLFKDERTLSQIFAENGYTNGLFGKWHLGDNYPFRPQDRGFHEVVKHGAGGIGQGPDFWGNDYFDDTFYHNGVPRQYKGYCTDVFFDLAMEFIEENQDKPFFCYISTNAPHKPYHVPEEYYNIYRDEAGLTDEQKRFYGMITNIDDNFLRLEQKLKDLRLKDNTIVIFMGDNGSSDALVTIDGKTFGYNAGLRGQKGSMYDGGHLVPFIMRWPAGGIQGGKDIDQLLAHIDVLPSMVELLKLRNTEQKPVDGKSFVPLLAEATAAWPDRTLIVDNQRLRNLVKWRSSAVMDERWRLINGEELYDIISDRGQEKDVSANYPEVVKRLRVSYEKWWQSLMDEGVNERYAYIGVGSPYENPVKINALDLVTGVHGRAGFWHQRGPLQPRPTSGVYKVEFLRDGQYRFSLARFPRESGLAIDGDFPGQNLTIEVSAPLPPSENINFTHAWLTVADLVENTRRIGSGEPEVVFESYIHAGKYDLDAAFRDDLGKDYPVYYLYIERID